MRSERPGNRLELDLKALYHAWDSKFTKAFVINSIPRYLLIGPDGNIVSGDAPRPSDQKLVELFDSLDI